jgi:hypothetical protein
LGGSPVPENLFENSDSRIPYYFTDGRIFNSSLRRPHSAETTRNDNAGSDMCRAGPRTARRSCTWKESPTWPAPISQERRVLNRYPVIFACSTWHSFSDEIAYSGSSESLGVETRYCRLTIAPGVKEWYFRHLSMKNYFTLQACLLNQRTDRK